MIIELTQGTEQWKVWRNEGICASEASVLLGKSPWCGVETLRLRKLGRLPPQEQNARMQYGHDQEEHIRQRAELYLGKMFFPACVTWDDDPYFRASLDGLSEDGTTVLEVKTCSRESYERACIGQIPEHYVIQCQHQLLCTDTAKECWIVMSHNGSDAYVQLLPDEALQDNIIKHGADFYHHLREDLPYSPKGDPLPIDDYVTLADLLDDYEQIGAEIDVLKSKRDELKRQIDETCDGRSLKCNNFSIKYGERTTFDFKKACVDNKLDVGLYKKETPTLSIRRVKDGD